MIIQYKDIKIKDLKKNLSTWHTCDICNTQYNFWDHPLEMDKIANWWIDTEDHITEICDKCYPKEIKKNRKCKQCGETNIFLLRREDYSKGAERDTTCVGCLNKSLEILFKEEAEKDRKNDAKMKQKGYTHKAGVWVHPKQGGDDYRVDFYFHEKPSKEKVQKLASHKGSAVLTDFTIQTL